MATKKFKNSELPIEETSDDEFEDVLEEIKDTSEELTETIEDYLESSNESIPCQPVQYILDLNIPYCKKCCLPFTVDLYGNPQCEMNIADCPRLKK